MDLELGVMLAGLLVGFVVGLTGMGGGALMTPILVLLFGINPLAAVSSDIVAAVVMKPVGGSVHMRRGTVNIDLVRWLAIGSVPAAFCGVLLLRAIGAPEFSDRLRVLLGAVLLVAAGAIVAKGLLQSRRPDRRRHPCDRRAPASDRPHRRDRRAGRRHDVGRFRLGDDRPADAPLPGAVEQRARRHRPRPGDPARPRGRDRPRAVRRPPARPHAVVAPRQRSRRVPGRARVRRGRRIA